MDIVQTLQIIGRTPIFFLLNFWEKLLKTKFTDDLTRTINMLYFFLGEDRLRHMSEGGGRGRGGWGWGSRVGGRGLFRNVININNIFFGPSLLGCLIGLFQKNIFCLEQCLCLYLSFIKNFSFFVFLIYKSYQRCFIDIFAPVLRKVDLTHQAEQRTNTRLRNTPALLLTWGQYTRSRNTPPLLLTWGQYTISRSTPALKGFLRLYTYVI